MKFIDYIELMEDIDHDLLSTEFGTGEIYNFTWDKEFKFTSFGLEEFKKVLNSPITVDGRKVTLLDSTITHQEMINFIYYTGGLCSETEFNRIIEWAV